VHVSVEEVEQESRYESAKQEEEQDFVIKRFSRFDLDHSFSYAAKVTTLNRP
jgi:hypothetical protein